VQGIRTFVLLKQVVLVTFVSMDLKWVGECDEDWMAVYDGSELVSQNINMCNYNARISVSLKFVAVMDALTKIVVFL